MKDEIQNIFKIFIIIPEEDTSRKNLNIFWTNQFIRVAKKAQKIPLT